MRDAAVEARGFIAGCDRQTLDSNRMLVFAMVRAIEIIGEAEANVSSECRERHPQIPWADIIGMRNRLVHAYFDIDLDILWNTATTDCHQNSCLSLLTSYYYCFYVT